MMTLTRKNKVLSEVIKMHEQNQTSQTYTNLFPGSSSPPRPQPSGPPPPKETQTSHSQCQPSPFCQNSPPLLYQPYTCSCLAWHCCFRKSQYFDKRLNHTDFSLTETLNNKVDKLQDELVDIVNRIEKLAENKTSQN